MKEIEKIGKEEVVHAVLDFLYENYPEAVKKWIYKKWPHGYGLYD